MKPIVRFLDQVLTDYGINVVTNYKNIDGGSNWKRTLKQLIEDSGYFVACFSKEFNEREKTVLYRGIRLPYRVCKGLSIRPKVANSS